MNFFAGDKVRFGDDAKVYTVSAYKDGRIQLKEFGSSWWEASRCTLVSHSLCEQKPELGTRFRIVRYEEAKMARVNTQNIIDQNIPTKKHDDIRCTCCGKKAPRQILNARAYYGDPLALMKHDLPDLTGWMVAEFPFHDRYMNHGKEGTLPMVTSMKEKDKCCPDCGTKIKQFMNHLKTPMYNPDIE